MLAIILEIFYTLLERTSLETVRYLYASFNIENRLTGIIGPRGVGKTTMMLQYIKQHLFTSGNVIYFSADLVYFRDKSLFDFVRELYVNEGFNIFFIDEIHQYENWQQELKNLYDAYPDIRIIFSGSSMLELIKGNYDLSRRSKLYVLHGLSFREYLNFVDKTNLKVIELEPLLKHLNESTRQMSLIPSVNKKFRDYLTTGYYPFALENKAIYSERLLRIIDKTIYEDIANFYNLKTPNLPIFKKILGYLALIPPGNVNTHNLAQNIQMSDQTTSHYLTILNEVGLIRMVYPYEGGNSYLRKPQKIFLNNTNLLNVLGNSVRNDDQIGTTRELFFVQSFNDAGYPIYYSTEGDYRTRDAVFEIGGKNKKRKQIRKTTLPAYLIKDDILISSQGIIPLMYFGMLY